MKTFIGSLLAVVVFFASAIGAVEAYWHDSGAAGGGHLALSEQSDLPADQGAPKVASDHCDHLAHHFFAQLPSALAVALPAVSADFAPFSVRPALSFFDTPIRPPRRRLS